MRKRMRKLLPCAGLVTVVCCSSFADQIPKSIFGVYGPAAPGRSRPAQNSIRITRRTPSHANIVLKLYYANGHTCQLNSDGHWEGDRLVFIAVGLEPNQSCKLEAFFPPGHIRLSDEGQRCAPVYCGARGKLDGVVLSKTRH